METHVKVQQSLARGRSARFYRIALARAAAGAAFLFPVATHAQPVERELGAHEHGRGVFNMAVEGQRLEIELEVPGMDIVGFEHPATTARQKAAVAQAKRKLESPGSVFTLPKAAGCALKTATATLEAGEHHADEAEASHHGAEPAKKGGDSGTQEHEHSEFHVRYALECTTPSGLTAVDFGYFGSFEGAQKLDVHVITAAGQSQFEVTRARPHLALSGMM